MEKRLNNRKQQNEELGIVKREVAEAIFAISSELQSFYHLKTSNSLVKIW